ncbi:Proteasome assembly chaperone 3, partial [Stegodyphus mimosarum]
MNHASLNSEVNAMNEAQKWCIKSKTSKGTVCGRWTDISVIEFRDKHFIIATDCGKIGSMIQVLPEASVSKSSSSILNSKVILGKDEAEIHAVARSLVEGFKFNKPVIFGFSVKEYTKSSVSDLKQLIATTGGYECYEEVNA